MATAGIRRFGSRVTAGAAALALALAVPGCAGSSSAGSSGAAGGRIVAVGAENEYSDVIGQIGGKYVTVSAIMSDPNTDPHTFEASPKVAQVISAAELVVQNGLGYDSFMNSIESGSPNPQRKVITVQKLLGVPDSTPNPHLWYDPKTMPAVAGAIASDLSALLPADAAYFHANLASFDTSLAPWTEELAQIGSTYPNAPVAVTEPVGDYMLTAAGMDDLTPFTFQADIMNGVDPSPQDVTAETNLFSQHRVKVFLYNQQVTDPITESILAAAEQNGIPVVGVYETMPAPGYDYQSWMVAEARALEAALSRGVSTQKL